MKENPQKRNYLVNRTIEYHEKTMIEEYTDANIPEFTLGPNNFETKEQSKPLSVNRMGFYEDWEKIEIVMSPIKKCDKTSKQRKIWNLNAEEEKLVTQKAGIQEFERENECFEEDFYDNKDIISNGTSSKNDSTKKYIELVDSIRNWTQQKEFDTPNFQIQRDMRKTHCKRLKLEDVLKEDNITCRSYQLDNNKDQNSSEVHTQRRSSITRAESDIADSFRLASKRRK